MTEDPAFSMNLDSSKIAIVTSTLALVVAAFQAWTAREQNEIQRQQIAQNEQFFNEETRRQDRPLVAFSKNVTLPVKRDKDGTFSWEPPSDSHLGGETSREILFVRNLGRGTAINTSITWMPDGGEFLKAVPEAPQLNSGAQSTVESFPFHAFKDGEKQCVGCVELQCQDVDGSPHSSCQTFHAVLDKSRGRISIAFTDLARQEPVDWCANSPYLH